MDNFVPKGIVIEEDGNSIIIRTEKKELVFSDYIGILFCSFWFGLIIYLWISEGLTIFYLFYFLVIIGLIGFFLLSLLFSFKEIQIITITEELIEIEKKRLLFSLKKTLDRREVERIEFKKLIFPVLTIPSIVIMLKFACNLGYYKIPRIVFRGGDIYVFEHYKKRIREWIVDYLDNITNKN